MVLARLLTPEDFGIFAMVVPLGIICSNISNQCVQTALLQSQVVSEDGLQSFFGFIARLNVAVAAGMIAVAAGLAGFYEEPRVIGVAAVWAATLIVLVPASFQEALLKRRMQFPKVMAVQLGTFALSVVVSVIAAWRGAGYWALPLQIVLMEIGRAFGIFLLSDWRPRWRADTVGASANVGHEEQRALRVAWRNLVVLRLSGWLRDLPDLVAVGRVGGTVVLGHYDTARRWAYYAFLEPFLGLTDVTLASLGGVREDPERFRDLMLRAVMVMLTISLPVIAFVAVEAESVVLVLLGPQWDQAVGFLRVLSIAAFAGAIVRVTRWIHLAHGRTGRLLRWSLWIETPATWFAVLIGLSWGATGVAAALAVASTVLIPLAIVHAVRGTSIGVGRTARCIARPVLASVLAALAVAGFGATLPTAHSPRLVSALALFGLAFVLVWHAIPGGLADTRALVRSVGDLRPDRTRK